VIDRRTGAAIELTCHAGADGGPCRVGLRAAGATRVLVPAVEPAQVAPLAFLPLEACPLRKKKNCLRPELWVSGRSLAARRAQVEAWQVPHGRFRARLDVDQVFTPFGLSAHVVRWGFFETMPLAFTADAVLLAPALLGHGTTATMSAARRKRIQRAMEGLAGEHPRPTRLRHRVFQRLVAALEQAGGAIGRAAARPGAARWGPAPPSRAPGRAPQPWCDM
jgi:hypothetical protein